MDTGWVACNYTAGDMLCEVRHAAVRATCGEAERDRRSGEYEGVRYIHTDGYLYVDEQ